MGLLDWWWNCQHKQEPKIGIKKFPAPPPPNDLLDKLNDKLHHIRDDLNTGIKVDQADIKEALVLCDEIEKFDCSFKLLGYLENIKMKLETLYIKPETSEFKLINQIKKFNDAYKKKGQ